MIATEMLNVLKEIKGGKEGQMIPYDIIVHAINPLQERGCLDAVIYLLEHIEADPTLKEAVAWIEDNSWKVGTREGPNRFLKLELEDWLAKLKEWGIAE